MRNIPTLCFSDESRAGAGHQISARLGGQSLAKTKDDMGHEELHKDEHFVEAWHATVFNQY
jgi:hypothetical protein